MIPLKEDGKLDIDLIHQLPIEEYIEVIENLSSKQNDYYCSNLSPNDGFAHTKAIFVDYTMEDEIARGAVNIREYIKEKRTKLGI